MMRFLLAILCLLAGAASTVFAACANPTSNAGGVVYNSGRHVMMF